MSALNPWKWFVSISLHRSSPMNAGLLCVSIQEMWLSWWHQPWRDIHEYELSHILKKNENKNPFHSQAGNSNQQLLVPGGKRGRPTLNLLMIKTDVGLGFSNPRQCISPLLHSWGKFTHANKTGRWVKGGGGLPGLWFCPVAPWGGRRCSAPRSGPPLADWCGPERRGEERIALKMFHSKTSG